MRYVDLHTHTSNSDGTDTVRQLIDKAVAKRLYAVAKTDHNTTAGNGEFVEYASGKPVRAIPGVEISTSFNNAPVHVVGLNVSDNGDLENALARLRESESTRTDAILAGLRSHGYSIDRADVEAFAGANPHRGKIADYMVHAGMVRDRDSAFRGPLHNLRIHAPSYRLTPAQAVMLIHAAGGKAVWAHPLAGRGARPDRELPFLNGVADAAGFDAVESEHSGLTRKQRALIKVFAESRGLKLSGGSDYHGGNTPYIELGTGLDNVSVDSDTLKALGV